MRHGSLFSGIGGFDLAAEWMGWENVFHCEWNEFGQKVLKHYWPKAISYEDITKTDFSIHRGNIDILTGGFPCQPYSAAGKRLGKEDERHLWPEMLRAIREIKPRWVVGENVYGLVNWSGGLVFHEIQTDLENQGYEVQPYLLPAVSVNAPHRRDRIWFVAKNTNENGWGSKQWEEISKEWGQWDIGTRNNERIRANNEEIMYATNTMCNGINKSGKDGQSKQLDKNGFEGGIIADTEYKGLEGQHRKRNGCTKYRCDKGLFIRSENQFIANWSRFPTVKPTIRYGDDGFSDRLDGITFPKWRNESIKAGGNAVVPQVVYQIFKTIEQYEHQA